MPEILIDLDKLAEPSGYLKLGSKKYPYKRWDLFSILEQKQLDRQWRRVIEIELAETISEEEANEYATLAREILGQVCDVPEGVLKKLTVTQLIEGSSGFFGVQQARQRARPILLTNMAREGLLKTSDEVSSGSSGSTEGDTTSG